jgi:hypothetical protein
MQFGKIVFATGVSPMGFGAVVEAVAVIGIASYRVRRLLPVASPIALQSVGCFCFCAGMVCAAFGAWLAR